MITARETERVGLVATGSTTFNEPYTLARQFKALDVISHGRAGWNAVTTSDPAAAANFGRQIPACEEMHERAHEVVHIVQGLWGSWDKDAWPRGVASKRFAGMGKTQPVNLQGRHVASRGPLPIPPSEQGQPVIFEAGGDGYGLELAGRYANPMTIEDGIAQRHAGVDWSLSDALPRLPDAAARIAAEVEDYVPGGDHTLLLAHVVTATAHANPRPLTHHRRSFGTHAPLAP
ncbi:LLM class flavin-dependent oxidoreductase [Streptomyces sp. NPDC051840]|uniref:LLM class flavin-dependent oxidoreductase n=1 Tax=Streptomyces sp. NPDC051840 TaxID=3154752 RepID=UPI003429CF99